MGDATGKSGKAPSGTQNAKCAWCGLSYQSTHGRKQFCTSQCGREFNAWCGSRGKTLFLAALAARSTRGRKGTIGADAQMERDRFLDRCAVELRERGGAAPAAIYRHSRKAGIPWFDHASRRK